VVSIARVKRATVFNVTNERIQVSSDGRTIKARSSGEVDMDDEVLTSALSRGEVVLLSQEQETKEQAKPATGEPAAEPAEAQAAAHVEETSEEAAETGEVTGQTEEAVSQAEETEASEEETKTKKPVRAKVAKEN